MEETAMVHFPTIVPSYNDLPEELPQRREIMIDIFGQHICWSRDLAIARIQATIESAGGRTDLEPGQRLLYERIAQLSADQRGLALELAGDAIDIFLRFLLALFANIGLDLRQDSNHVIWYKLVSQIYHIPADAVIEEVVLNREQMKFLPDYLPIWLEQYGKPKGSTS
jgi:hypothetical protein